MYDVAAPSPGRSELERLTELPVAAPYVKDYDAIAKNAPSRWPLRFDVSKWGLLVARHDGARVGGAVVAVDTPGVQMLDDRHDVAVLWDIRVAPDFRRQHVGSVLFGAAEAWARTRGCHELKVETQNINVPACRLYARSGCTLETVDPFAYRDFPGEIQLIWSKVL